MLANILISLAIVLVVFSLGFFYVILTSPELQYHSFWYRLKAKIVFWLGDIRRLHSFPWVTWDVHSHKVNLTDARRGASLCEPGDIGLHRDEGYLSNLGIPGAFKHAWICVGNGEIVEAISEGVVQRDELYPLVTDYAVILRPRGLTAEQVGEAVERAKGIVGSQYDANFRFDFEESGRDVGADRFCRNLKCGSFHGAFSCTEVVGYAYFPFRAHVRLFRSMHAGREAIIADDYLKMNFDVVWVSESVSEDWMKEHGLHEHGRFKVTEFIKRTDDSQG